MITNEKQYKITKAQADKFQNALYTLNSVSAASTLVATAQREALKSQYEDLKEQLEEYELLKSGKIAVTEAHNLDELPQILIRARIAQGLTQTELADKLGMKTQQIQRYESEMYASASFKRLNEIAGVLSVTLKNNAEFLVNASNDGFWSNFPIKEMWERGWFEGFSGTLKQAMQNAEELITGFFYEARMKNFATALHKKKPRAGSKLNQFALLAWQARITQKAFFTPATVGFSPSAISDKWLRGLLALSQHNDGPLQAKNYLAKAGIHLVIEPHLQGTYLDGAAMKGADNEPIIALTLRYDRLDIFWFCLLHELGHIVKHLYGPPAIAEPIFDEELEYGDTEDIEIEADIFAFNASIPQDEWELSPVRFVSDPKAILKQAEVWKISPAIIAGRICREQPTKEQQKQAYIALSGLLGNNKVRHLFE